MWTMIAEPGLRCAECRHTIRPGRLCLSGLPEEMPAGVSRSDFRNYCIGCPECWRQGQHACYVRHLESGSNVGGALRSLPCMRCGRYILSGEKARVQTCYDWPEMLEDEAVSRNGGIAGGAIITAAGADVLIRGVPFSSFADLSRELQQKFKDAGLGDEYGEPNGHRSKSLLYHDSGPYSMRNLGENSVQQYLADKDASHIVSKENAPRLADHPGNLI